MADFHLCAPRFKSHLLQVKLTFENAQHIGCKIVILDHGIMGTSPQAIKAKNWLSMSSSSQKDSGGLHTDIVRALGLPFLVPK